MPLKPRFPRKLVPRRLPKTTPVTVCINAIGDNHEAIVSCVDTRISAGMTSYDPVVGRKMCGFRGWTILSSGTLAEAESLIDAFQDLLGNAQDNDPPTVQRCLEEALRIELPRFSAARFLAPYGLDMPTFLSSRASFTEETWNELSRQMFEYSETYDVELLVSGWGGRQEAFSGSQRPSGYIFAANRNGVTSHSDEGFFVSGSGGDAAHSILSFFNQQPHMTLAQTVYYVAAAKFMSERTAFVGPSTILRVARRRGEGDWRGFFIHPREVAEIRRVWERTGQPRMHITAEVAVVELLSRHESGQRVSNEHIAYVARRETRRSPSRRSEPEQ
jgi:hypothetical protein